MVWRSNQRLPGMRGQEKNVQGIHYRSTIWNAIKFIIDLCSGWVQVWRGGWSEKKPETARKMHGNLPTFGGDINQETIPKGSANPWAQGDNGRGAAKKKQLRL